MIDKNKKILFLSLISVILLTIFAKNYLVSRAILSNTTEFINTELSNCYEFPANSPEKDMCFKLLAKNLVKSLSFPKIMNELNNVVDTKLSCHNVMHYVINEEYKKGLELPEIYAECTSACFSACYHGGLEGYFINKNLEGATPEKINEEILHVCDVVTKMKYQCYHGLGHALMILYNGELIESLKSCDVLGENASQCYGGAFMENLPFSNTQSDHPILYLKKDDPLYPCNILEDRYKRSCYSYQVSNFIYLANSDWKKVGEYCEMVPEGYRWLCFQRIGSASLGLDADFDYPKQICANLRPGFQEEYCTRGVAESFSDRFAGNEEKFVKMVDFCLTVKEEYKSACFDQVGLTFFSSEVNIDLQRSACEKVENLKHRQSCMMGID